MSARLVSSCGYPTIALEGAFVIVGRHENCDVTIHSSRVSRQHCCLALDHGTLVVRDLCSTNGTWINGARIESGTLRCGDELLIAHLGYRLEIDADPGDTRPPSPRPIAIVPAQAETLPPTDLHDCIEGPDEGAGSVA